MLCHDTGLTGNEQLIMHVEEARTDSPTHCCDLGKVMPLSSQTTM